jgi:hypothetical protein
MVQVSVCPATADRRSQWRALRPVLILGGFVAVWWALMTGVAQADSTPHHHLVDHLRSQVQAQHHDTPLRDAVRRTHHDVKATTGKVHHQARNTTRPVTRTVSTVVDSTPLAPVAAKATTTIRTTLSTTVATTRALVAKSAAGPVVDAVEDAVKDAVENPESSTGQGNSHSPRHATKATDTLRAKLLSANFGQYSPTPDQAQASTDADGPGHGPRGIPSLPDPCASPSGSGTSSSFTPVGITESSLLVMPRVLSDHHTWRLARLPVGPAYQPGSSPD